MPVNPKDEYKVYERFKLQRANVDSTQQELADYIQPRKGRIISRDTFEGGKRTQKLFDSTAPDANQKLAASIHGALTGPTTRWFSFKLRNSELNEKNSVKMWLRRAADKMFAVLQQSNFAAEIEETYSALGAFGISSIFAEEIVRGNIFRGVHFKTIDPGQYCIMEDKNGTVNTIYREVWKTRAVWKQIFGNRLSRDFIRRTAQSPEEKVSILHIVKPRGGVPEVASPGTVAKKMPFASIWLETSASGGDVKLLREGGFRKFPFAVPRWSTDHGESYGRGPGHLALPDIKTLNAAVKMRLKAWAKTIDPALLYRDRGVIGRLKTKPSSLNAIRGDTRDAVLPMQFGAQFDVANFQEEDLRRNIRQIFFNDQLQLPDKSIITATEADLRIELMQRVLGPTLGRLDNELLRVLVDVLFEMMLIAGEFNPIPPEILFESGGQPQNIDIEYDGPLARAQRASELSAIDRFVASTLPLAEAKPDILDNIDFDELARIAGRSQSVGTILRSKEDVEAIRESRQQAQEEAARQQQILEGAEAIGKAAPGLEAASELQPFAGAQLAPPEEDAV